MATNFPSMLGQPLAGFTRLPVQRQLGLLLGAALTLAVAASLFLWLSRPDFQQLHGGLPQRDVVAAMETLSQHGIRHRLDPAGGELMVPREDLHRARLHLATEGLPSSQGVGFELLDQDTGLTTSRMLESARYQRALEGELARSIRSLRSVEGARVHLALAQQSVFIRERSQPTASVVLGLHPGGALDEAQVAGIVHLVASSVPDLRAENVTVVDQRGRRLNHPDDGEGISPSRQLAYLDALENAYRRRVVGLLAPLLGEDSVRVQVTADVDFSQVESTRELFDPDGAVLRSEQLREEESTGNAPGGGVPGALTNQPPAGGVPLLETEGEQPPPETGAASAAGNRSFSTTRNFELDRTISHVREAPASLRRLSVAVVVDDRLVPGEDGARERLPREAAEMEHLQALVREAVGFDAERGDSINLVNASFREFAAPQPPPAPPIWEQRWVQELARQGLAGLAILVLAVTVLRPALRTLAQQGRRGIAATLPAPGAHATSGLHAPKERGEPGAGADAPRAADTPFGGAPSAGDSDYEGTVSRARGMAAQDPSRVAQVVKQWVAQDGS